MIRSLESKKIRDSFKDIQADRMANIIKGEGIKEAGKKLVMGKKQVDEIGTLAESLDLPKEEKAKLREQIDIQKQALRGSFEEDVEKPTRELDKEQKELSGETREYSDSAAKNEKKINEFNKTSGMDDSAIKQAGQEQSRLKEVYRNETEGIEDDRKKHESDIAELRRQIGK
jgi:hypothetical protein